MAYRRKDSPYWWVKYTDASGKRTDRSTGTTDRREAQALEAKWRLEAHQMRQWGVQPEHTFDEARRAFLNRARFRAEHCPDSDWVFAHRKGKRIRFMQNGFQAACTRAKIKSFRVHDLRHTFASWLVQGGVPLLEVAKLLGHSTIEMTERYAHLAPENLKAAVGVLDRLRNGYVDRAEQVVALKVSA